MRSSVRLASLLLTALAAPVGAQESQTASRPAERTIEPVKPPESVDALQQLHDALTAEMEQLRPTTRASESAPASQPAEVVAARQTAAALYLSLEQLDERVRQHLAVRKQLEDLKRPEKIEAFARELAALQQRTNEAAEAVRDLPPVVSEEDVRKIQAELDARVREIGSRTTVQAERAKSLASAAQRIAEAKTAAQKALAALHETGGRLQAQLDAAKTDAERRLVEQLLRKAEVDAALPAFDEILIRLTEERDTILQGQSERRMPLLRALLTALAEWRNALQQIRSRSEREQLEWQLQFLRRHPDSAPAFQATLLELCLLESQAIEELGKHETDIRRRFPRSRAEELKLDVAAEQAHWALFMDSLERRPSEHIRDRYRQVNETIAAGRKRLASYRRSLDRTVDEQQEITILTDGYDERIRKKEAEFKKQLGEHAAANPGDARAEEASQQHDRSKRRYTDQVQSIQTDLADLIGRLKEACMTLEGSLATLQQHRSRLYWRHLYVVENPIWSYRTSITAAEWRSEVEQSKRTADISRLRRLGRLNAATQGLAVARWCVLAAALLLVMSGALWLRRRAIRYADATMKTLIATRPASDDERAPISDRLHLLAARYAARTAPVAGPALTAMLFVPLYDLTGTSASLVLSALGLVAGLSLSEALFRWLFVPSKPRLRLLRCSNVVAAHYRRWATGLWLATLLLLPLPLFLWAMDWPYTTRSYLWSLYRIAALTILLAFGISRQMVLRVVGRPEQVTHRGILAVLSAAYPLLWAATAGLLAAEIAGYGALVTYVVLGSVATVATTVVAMLVARYLTDLLLRVRRSPDAPAAAEPTAPSPERSGSGPAPARDTHDQPDGEAETARITRSLAAALIRWGIAAVAIFVILRYWGITTVEIHSAVSYQLLGADESLGRPAITVGRVLAAALSIVAAWWASRAIRTVLDTRVYTVYAAIDRGARAAINTIIHYFVMLLGLYFALYAVRVPLGAVTVVLGTVGLGVGLGLQPLFVNFISGLMILFERHVRVGDIVEVGNKLGEVTGISMRSTSIKTFDNIDLVIPNSEFITQSVVNWTFHEARVRGRVPVSVAYGSDEQLVKRLLIEVARRHPLVLPYPPPDVWFTGFGESSLDFVLVAWFRNPGDQGRFLNQIRFEISRVFKEHGVEIPFPHRTLTTPRGEPLSVRVVAPDAPPPASNPAPPPAGER